MLSNIQSMPEGNLKHVDTLRVIVERSSSWFVGGVKNVHLELFYNSDDVEVTQEPDFDVGELSSTGRQVEVSLGGAVQLACPPGEYLNILQEQFSNICGY